MSLTEELLRTKQATELKFIEASIPKGWRASSRKTGDVITETTEPLPEGSKVTHESLLRMRNYDPNEWRIVGNVRDSSWDVQLKGGIKSTFSAYKFEVAERVITADNLDDLIKSIGKRKAPKTLPELSPGTFVYLAGDYQLGKSDGDGIEGTLARIYASAEAAVAIYKAQGSGRPEHVHIAWLGDCIEGNVSQGGKNMWRTRQTVTEQVRVLRRIMLYVIDLFAPHAKRVTVVSVPGNHDEAMRLPVATRSDDSWAVDSLIAVSDALELNPAAYGHVECYVPGVDEQDVTMELDGLVVTHIHGHQYRPGKQWDWWKGQMFGGQPAGQSKLLLQGHMHHYSLDTKGDRMWICVPAFEQESTWWKHRTGETGSPGGLVFTIRNQTPQGLTVL